MPQFFGPRDLLPSSGTGCAASLHSASAFRFSETKSLEAVHLRWAGAGGRVCLTNRWQGAQGHTIGLFHSLVRLSTCISPFFVSVSVRHKISSVQTKSKVPTMPRHTTGGQGRGRSHIPAHQTTNILECVHIIIYSYSNSIIFGVVVFVIIIDNKV